MLSREMSASDNPPSSRCHIDYLQSAAAGLHVFKGRQSEYQRGALLAAADRLARLPPQTDAIRGGGVRLPLGWRRGGSVVWGLAGAGWRAAPNE